jgi:mRNA interferase MazF
MDSHSYLRGTIRQARLEDKTDIYCVIIQNDKGNFYSPITIVAAIVDACNLKQQTSPIFVDLPIEIGGLPFKGVVLCDQIHSIDKKRLNDKITGRLSRDVMYRVDVALERSLFNPGWRYGNQPLIIEPSGNIGRSPKSREVSK